MKIVIGISSVVLAAILIFGGSAIGAHLGNMASDIPIDDASAPSCMWSDAVLDVDDYMTEHPGAAADIYLEVTEKGEAAAKADFLSNLYSQKVSDECADNAWDWTKQAYLKFETPGHTSMDAGWLNS